MDCCCVGRTCAARATYTHTGGVDVEASLQSLCVHQLAPPSPAYGYDMDPAAGELSLIAVGSDESAASLVVSRFGLVELLELLINHLCKLS